MDRWAAGAPALDPARAAAAVTELAHLHGGTLSTLLTERARTIATDEALRFMDYATDRHGIAVSLSFGELDRRVTAMAALLSRRGAPGDRVAVMTPQGVEFVVGFLAVLRAGLVAVPLFSPDLPGHSERLSAVVADCRPALALASATNVDIVREFIADRGSAIDVLVVDELDRAEGDGWTPPVVRPDEVAYLQYTSGSTRLPCGVRITHGNIVNNAAQAVVSCRAEPDCTLVSWLPLFHDMGLVFVVGGSLVGGMTSVLLDPLAFLMKPTRWLKQLAENPRTISPGPNFAFEYCAKRVPEQERNQLDLSGVHVIFNGAEPIAATTLTGFYDAFEGAGLRRGVIAPSYGLAEATVYVCADVNDGRTQWVTVNAGALSDGKVELAEPGPDTVDLVSCGSDMGKRVAIADPATGTRLPPGVVGEIWVNDDSVGAGYWSQHELSAEVFDQQLHDCGDLRPTGWLRSGDLGVMIDDRLFVTGRIKDLIIVDGRNHYPQDVERTVEESHPVIGHHRTAAFAVAGPMAGEAGERAVLVAEISRHHVDSAWDPAEVRRVVAAAVSRDHGLALSEIVLIAPDTIPRTTSGKIARTASREAYEAGSLVEQRPEG